MYKTLILFLLSINSLSATLIVGTNAEFKPFCFIENDQIVGFDIDIAKQVCKHLDVEMKIKDMPFDAIIPEITLGQVHFAAAGMSYTPERAKRVLFSSSYLSEDPLVIVTLGKKLTLEDLPGKQVVVNEGYVADTFLSDRPGVTLIRLPTIADGFLALKLKRADAFVTAKSTFTSFSATQPALELSSTVIEGTDQTCALVISKKYPELQEKIQAALDQMQADGTIDTIKTKWGLS